MRRCIDFGRGPHAGELEQELWSSDCWERLRGSADRVSRYALAFDPHSDNAVHHLAPKDVSISPRFPDTLCLQEASPKPDLAKNEILD